MDRLIGFEDLGHNDQFTSKALEFRLSQSGALPTGKILLVNELTSDLLDEVDGSEERDGEGAGKGEKLRRGKMGIRDGFAAGQRDTDEWE